MKEIHTKWPRHDRPPRVTGFAAFHTDGSSDAVGGGGAGRAGALAGKTPAYVPLQDSQSANDVLG